MHVDKISNMIEKLTECALLQLETGVENVDTCEMGAVVDMIKDLCDAEKNARISLAMNEEDNGIAFNRLTLDTYRQMEHARDMDARKGRMYYSEPLRDAMSAYEQAMESYAGGSDDKAEKLRLLESYMKVPLDDIAGMLPRMSAEEKQLAKNKLSAFVMKF